MWEADFWARPHLGKQQNISSLGSHYIALRTEFYDVKSDHD